MTTDVLLVAKNDDEWPDPVIELLDQRLSVSRVDALKGPANTVDYTNVRIIVGGPAYVAPWVSVCPNLQWIQSTWAGVDALAETVPDGVTVTPLKDVFGQSMSEFVMGWILAIERRILERAATNSWDERAEDGLHGKTMGILGTGSIGTAIAVTARQFGIRCRGLNSDGRLIDGFESCFQTNNRQFFDDVDYLVSVLPKTRATDNIIDSDALQRLNTESIVMNIGRGNAIDDEALLKAISLGTIKAAVLDVFREEPLPKSHAYWHTPNIYITAHTSAPTLERFVAQAMAPNLDRFLAGQDPLGAFDPSKGY